jgi:hypothetical protein
MPDRVHHHPNLIYSLGTQVVTLVEVLGRGGKVLHPRGSVGVVIYSPADLDHPYESDLLMVSRSRLLGIR